MPPVKTFSFPHGITAIDTYFQRPMMAASHLIVDNAEAAFIDVGTKFSVPILLEALGQAGLSPASVKYVIVTHIHLDHAGGAGHLMKLLPNATFIVHPRGGRHMIDPTKLWAGALQVYGEQEMKRTYGELIAIPKDRVKEMGDQTELSLGQRSLHFFHTPGHAKHHFSIFDTAANSFFTGDTFGLSYRELDSPQGPFIFPTTTPVHFDPEAMHASIDLIMSHKPESLYLTHFSRIRAEPSIANKMHQQIDELVALAQSLKNAPNRHRSLCQAIENNLLNHIEAHGASIPKEKCLELLAIDIELNSQGLGVWLDSQS